MAEQIATYVEPAEKRSIGAHAKARDLSISEWVRDACREKVEREGVADTAQRYRIEQRVLRLVDSAADRAADQIVTEVLEALHEEDVLPEGDTFDWGDGA